MPAVKPRTSPSFGDYTEAYSAVSAHQQEALAFHCDMANLFDFLGLRGFKRMHEYQLFAESIDHRRLDRYYLNHHGALIPLQEKDYVPVIPSDWYKYTRADVTPSIRKQYVQKAVEQYRDWECETKDLYEATAKQLLDWGMIADFNLISSFVKDVDLELKYLERLCIELKSVEYSSEYIEVMQAEYHEKYKKLCEELRCEFC